MLTRVFGLDGRPWASCMAVAEGSGIDRHTAADLLAGGLAAVRAGLPAPECRA